MFVDIAARYLPPVASLVQTSGKTKNKTKNGHRGHPAPAGALLPPGAGTAQRARRAGPLLPRPGDGFTLTQGVHAVRGRGIELLARVIPRTPRAIAAARVRHAGASRTLLPAGALSPTGAVELSPRRGGRRRGGRRGRRGGGFEC
eukprot:scaffold79139_cov60-Phaeocystis_antarctica.AAC.4